MSFQQDMRAHIRTRSPGRHVNEAIFGPELVDYVNLLVLARHGNDGSYLVRGDNMTSKLQYCQVCGDGNAWPFLDGAVVLCAVCVNQLTIDLQSLAMERMVFK